MPEIVALIENPYLSSMGVTPALSTRPASALIFLSLLMRFSGITEPTWLFSGWTLVILVAVMLIEWKISKELAIVELLEPFMPFLKAAVAIMVAFVLIDTRTSEAASSLFSADIISDPLWRTILDVGWMILMGVLGFIAALYRSSFYFFFSEFDQDNDLGLLTLYSWMEVFFTATGTLLALIVPAAAIVLYIVTALTLYVLRQQLEKLEENKRVACKGNCGDTIYPSAVHCPRCYAPNPHPMHVGLLGQTTNKPVTDIGKHPWLLLAQKRCPRCATRFKGRDMHQICGACGTSVLDSPEAVHAYVGMFDQKLSSTMLICFGLGFIPFAGLIAAVVYYRLTLVSPMRRYVPVAQGCLGRWVTRIFNLFMIALQPIFICGAFALPLMCYVNYKLYRGMLIRAQYRPKSPPMSKPLPS